jgi:uncharacterized protein
MEFNVAQLLKAGVGDTRVYEICEDIGDLDGTQLTTALAGKVRMTRMPRTILVEADLKTKIALTCSRCLEEIVQPLSLQFVEEYEPTVDIDTGAPFPVVDTDERFRINENHILDLAEAVREYGLLAMPMQPICRPECKGLCPECGQNLNIAQCTCSAKKVDSRLATLQRLLDEDD